MLVGKDQVSVGIVALNSQHRSSQSAKSVFPLLTVEKKGKLNTDLDCLRISCGVLLFSFYCAK